MSLLRLIPRLAVGGTKVGGAGGVAALAAGGLSSIIRSLGVDQAVEAGEASLATPMFEPIKERDEIIQFRSPSVRDLFDEIDVKSKEIVPELGPEEDRYEKHLNLIIERVARLEGEAATQNELIARLSGNIKESDDQQRRFNLEEKRQRTEDNIEGRGRTSELFEKIKEGAQTTGRNVGAILKALALPVAAFTAAHFLNKFSEESDDEETISNLIDTSLFVFEKVTQAGLLLGGSVKLQATRLSGMAARTGQAVGSMAPVQAAAARVGTTIATAMQPITQTARSVGATAARFSGAITTPITTATGAAATRVSTALAPITANVAKITRSIQNLRMLQSLIQGLQKGADKITTRVLEWARRLPTRLFNFIKNVAKKALRYYLIFESILFMITLAERYMMGTITEAEYHAQNKEQLNQIVSILGAPMFLAFIGGLVGAGVGGLLGSIFPVVGTIIVGLTGKGIGSVVGFLIGCIWGDDIFKAVGIDKFVDALYDLIFQWDTEPMKELFLNVVRWAANEAPKIFGRALLDALNPSRVILRGARAAMERFSRAPDVSGDFEQSDTIPTSNEIPIPPLRTGETTNVIMRDGSIKTLSEEEINEAFDEGLISIASRDSALSILARDRSMEERRVAQIEAETAAAESDEQVAQTETVTPASTSSIAQSVNINFSESELQQADPILYDEYVEYKSQKTQLHFEQSNVRNVRNNPRIAQANRQTASMKARRDAAIAFETQINNVLGEESIIVSNQSAVNNQASPNIIAQSDSAGRTVVVPIVQPPVRYGQSTAQSIGTGPKSQLESASPTYNTSDSFLEAGQVT
jgi:hypothetical protein